MTTTGEHRPGSGRGGRGGLAVPVPRQVPQDRRAPGGPECLTGTRTCTGIRVPGRRPSERRTVDQRAPGPLPAGVRSPLSDTGVPRTDDIPVLPYPVGAAPVATPTCGGESESGEAAPRGEPDGHLAHGESTADGTGRAGRVNQPRSSPVSPPPGGGGAVGPTAGHTLGPVPAGRPGNVDGCYCVRTVHNEKTADEASTTFSIMLVVYMEACPPLCLPAKSFATAIGCETVCRQGGGAVGARLPAPDRDPN